MTTAAGGAQAGITANSFSAVSLDPPLVFSQGRYAVADDHPAIGGSRESIDGALEERDYVPSISTLLFHAHQCSSAWFEKHRRAEGLSLAQTRLLFTLRRKGGLKLEE